MSDEEIEAIKELQNKHIFFSEYEAIEDYETENNIDTILNLIEKQQKEIERLKEESIGDTKFDKLLFSIRMLHFHNYVNDKQFAGMIKKLSDENKGEQI